MSDGDITPVYSEVLYRPDVAVEQRDVAVVRSGRMALNQLLRRLPNATPRTATREQAYHSNVDLFVKKWLKKSNIPVLLAYRTPFTGQPFLSDEAAVDVLSDMDIIPAEAADIGVAILRNSQAGEYKTAKDLQSTKGWLYDIAPAMKDSIPGFVLQRYSRGL